MLGAYRLYIVDRSVGMITTKWATRIGMRILNRLGRARTIFCSSGRSRKSNEEPLCIEA